MIKKFIIRPYYYQLIFLGVILIQFASYGYFSMMNEVPVGVHMWRQSDCLSFVMNYYEHGMNFLKPQVHHVLGGNGYTAAEFPGLYYLLAMGYHIFGPHEWVYRLSWMMLLLTGLYCFYRTLLMYLKDEFWAIGLTALMFCSPVLVSYGNSFIIDPAALSFTLIAWYFFAHYLNSGKWKWLISSILAYTLSGMLKEPSLITFVALCGLSFIWWANRWVNSGKMPAIPVGRILLFGLPVAGVLSWYFFKVHYNEINRNVAFLATIMPIWELSSETISEIATHIGKIWKKDYFEQWTLWFTVVLFLVNMYHFRRNWLANLFVLVVFLGALSFVLLFYWQFRQHDYYVINILLIIPITWAVFVKNFEKKTMGTGKTTLWAKAVFSAILVLNIIYAADRQGSRYSSKWNWIIADKDRLHHLKEADEYLTSLGVARDDKIISTPDITMNLTLYLLNRPGWTNVYVPEMTIEEVNKYIGEGAKYLVISDTSELRKPYVQPFKDNKIGQYEEISVYKLEKP